MTLPTPSQRSISLQVTTLPDIPGDPNGALSGTYHFMLELPILIPPVHFTELHAKHPADKTWGASDNRGWFHAGPRRKTDGIRAGASPTADGLAVAFTQHTLHVPRDVFLSHIAAHNLSGSESEPVIVPWSEWAPRPRRAPD